MSAEAPLSRVRPVFRAVVMTVAPRATAFGEGEWREAERLVNDALAQRPAPVRRQFVGFLRLLDLIPLLRHRRTFTTLPGEARLQLLRRLERAPLLLLRRGTWGVRTLAFLAVYGQDAVREAMGYRASAAGWDARGGTASPEGPGTEGAAT